MIKRCSKGKAMIIKALKHIKGCNFHPYKTMKVKPQNRSKTPTFYVIMIKFMQDQDSNERGKL